MALFERILISLMIWKMLEQVGSYPLVINTWPFTEATKAAWDVLTKHNGTAMDAVEAGCSICESLQCDGSVGFGHHPDENGETTLDAMVMDGKTHRVGAVACLRRVKHAVSVARAVMDYTQHSMLAGELATKFAIEMGFPEEDLHTPDSIREHLDWLNDNCQPNYRQNVSPDPTKSCGPYTPRHPAASSRDDATLRFTRHAHVSETNHDTIGMIAIDVKGDVAVGTSTNGMNHKVPGRVADSPIPGAGGYADNAIGGAAATGDGDVMMTFLPSYQTVESMRRGMAPVEAAKDAIHRIVKVHPQFQGAIVAANVRGIVGAACHGFENFKFSLYNTNSTSVQVISVACTK